jgi:phosphoribosyl-dephospho-CoA transferase
MTIPRAHDLLRVVDIRPLMPVHAPAWVGASLSLAPWVVVRRAPAALGWVPAGVRGPARSQRYALEVSLETVVERLAPEALVERIPRVAGDRPAIAALQMLAPILEEIGLPWGPTGSVGFTLATGTNAITRESDLDLIIRTPRLLADPEVQALLGAVEHLPRRVDIQLELPSGAVWLTELAAANARVMVRTPSGPRLCETGRLAAATA